MNDYSQIVISLHAVARALENEKQTWVFGNELRDLADRLHRATQFNTRTYTPEEKRIYEYAMAMAGMPLQGADNV